MDYMQFTGELIDRFGIEDVIKEDDVAAFLKEHGINDPEQLAMALDFLEKTGAEILGRISPEPVKSGQSVDSITLYLNEIGRIRLLTREEEIACARKARAGDQEARSRMIESNLRLVVSIAKRYTFGGELMDLVQAGNLGLIRAVDTYDPERGIRFGSYARFWIKQFVNRSISNTYGIIRLPAYAWEMLPKIYRFQEEYSSRNQGKLPTAEVLSRKFHLQRETVESILRVAGGVASIDDFGDNETEDSVDRGCMAEDNRVEDCTLLTFMREEIEKVLKKELTEKEQFVVQMRYGINKAGTEMTLGEIGMTLGISKERVRQILLHALKKLRFSENTADSLLPWYSSL